MSKHEKPGKRSVNLCNQLVPPVA